MSTPHPYRRITTSPRLRPLVTALAAICLAASGAGPVVARSVPASGQAPAPVVVAPPTGLTARAVVDRQASILPTTAPVAALAPIRVTIVDRPNAVPQAVNARTKRAAHTPAHKPAAHKPAAPATYRGTNHLWVPSLGINRSVGWFSCSRSSEPANYVYRWGCAGANNVYLLGHAWGVFKPLHDAYYNGRLRKGMRVVYADGNGRVSTYRVTWWKVVRPTTNASWAWAALARPSMTLQTCIGSSSRYRLMVRLVRT